MIKKYNKVDISKLLSEVNKPSRYIGLELNSFNKQPSDEKVNFCLAFPDLYEVGFSHLGIKILYTILNEENDCVADRVYAPWDDMGTIMKRDGQLLFGIESKVAVKDFDVLGFTLQSELNFSNIPYMLDLAQIPYYAKDRGIEYPIIIGGGPSITNPKPLEAFFDAILIGEGEEAIIEFKNLIKKHGRTHKNEILQELANLKGWYVPSVQQEKVKIRKYWRFSENLSKHKNQLIPWQQATHDRYVAEIMRGCSRGCRFCHAGLFYRPVRERNAQDIVDDMLHEIQNNGWEQVNLSSLSSSDYFCIKPLLMELKKRLGNSQTKVSLPSLRVDTLDDSLISLVETLGKSGLTIAPEAGTQRLRDVINKNISQEEIIEGIKTALRFDWRLVKLYFMIGLPTETEDDIDGIIDLINSIISIAGKKLNINVTISPFVPKPHTSFQWVPMLDREILLKRAYKVKNAFTKKKFVKVKYHQIESSLLEAVFARGDEKLSDLLIHAYKNGCYFDGWKEKFDFSKWQKSFEDLGIDYQEYIGSRSTTEVLPWSKVDMGITPKFLLDEWSKAQEEVTTAGCLSQCTNCGVCDQDHRLTKGVNIFTKLDDKLVLKDNSQVPVGDQAPRYHYRVYYQKVGVLRFVGHLDLMRMIYRIVRKSNLAVIYSQGFNKHPKIKLAPPLSLGVEGLNEFFEIQSNSNLSEEKLLNAFSFVDSAEMKITKVRRLSKADKRSLDAISSERVKIIPDVEFIDKIIEGIKKYEESSEWYFIKEKKGKEIKKNIKDNIKSIKLVNDGILIQKRLIGINVYDIMESLFGINREKASSFRIIREKLIIPVDVVILHDGD